MHNYRYKRYSLYKWASHHKPFTSLREGGGPHERVVEGERDCVFSELEVKLWAEGDGVCFPQKITLIY